MTERPLLSFSRLQRFFSHSNFLDQVFANAITGSGRVADGNHSRPTDFHLRFDDVFFPIPLGSGHIAGQSEIIECGQCDVVRPPHTRFQHASAPYRNIVFLRDIVRDLGMEASEEQFQRILSRARAAVASNYDTHYLTFAEFEAICRGVMLGGRE